MDEPEPVGRQRRSVAGGPLDGKPFAVTGYEVWCAWQQVRENKEAPGVDRQSIAAFEERLEDNLYKVWNRMSSGTWFPPPVKAAVIPKPGGGTRTLGVPTIADRVAQTVAANRIGTVTERFFHADSYGYRPGRGAHDALAVARKRCWKFDWVAEFDIRVFSGSVPHDLVVRAVEGLRLPAWVLLYVKTVARRAGDHAGRRGQGEGPGDPAGVCGHAPNAKGNFCFEATLGYRRVERGR